MKHKALARLRGNKLTHTVKRIFVTKWILLLTLILTRYIFT